MWHHTRPISLSCPDRIAGVRRGPRELARAPSRSAPAGSARGLERPRPDKELRPGGPKRIAREIRESELGISATLAQLRGMTRITRRSRHNCDIAHTRPIFFGCSIAGAPRRAACASVPRRAAGRSATHRYSKLAARGWSAPASRWYAFRKVKIPQVRNVGPGRDSRREQCHQLLWGARCCVWL